MNRIYPYNIMIQTTAALTYMNTEYFVLGI